MATQKSNIPALRFPEFKGDWEETRLGKIGEFVSGIGFTESEQGGQNGVPFFKVSDMNLPENTHEMRVANNYVTESQIQKEKYKPINRKSIIFAKVGAAVFLERKRLAENFLIDNNMMAFLPNEDQRISFYKILFERIRLSKYAQVGALPSYNSSDLKTIKLKLPLPKEQKKIAEFLTAVDQKIARLTEKKSCLEQYKKGVMQRLFTQRLRFHDTNGNPFPDWEEKRLGDIGDIYQPQTISQSDLSEDGYLVYGANGIIGRYNQFNHEQEQVCVTCRGSTCGEVTLTEPKSWITGNAMVINLDNSKIAIKRFIYNYLINDNLRYLITGSGQPQITGAIKNHPILVPCLKEQQKIADFLTAIDAKITALGNQLTAAQDFKKSLLQKMFV